MTDTSHLPESPLPDLETVIGAITDAFAGVRLGDGIGLHEAEGIDDHENAETLARLRQGDEKENWAAIPTGDLHRCHSAFSFFDAKGARFHLPAFLIDDLKLPYGGNFDAVSFLTRTVPLYPEKVALLDDAQRSAIRLYLRFFAAQDHCGDWDREDIRHALEGYWAN